MGAYGGRSPAHPDDELRGVALWAARAGWVAVTALLVALNVPGIPKGYALLSSICRAGGERCGSAILNPTQVKELPAYGFSLSSYAATQVAILSAGAVIWMAIALIIFLRRSSNPVALFVSFTLVVFAGTVGRSPTEGLMGSWASGSATRILIVECLRTLSGLCFAALFYVFPSGRWIPRWTRRTMIVWTLYAVASNIALPAIFGQQAPAGALLFVALSATMVIAQVYRYRAVSTPGERIQTRWVIYGFAVGLSGFLLVGLINLYVLPPFGEQTPLQLILVNLGLGFSITSIPVAFLAAMAYSRLFDIDVLIKRTLVYGSVSLTLAAVYFGGVIGLQQAMRPFTGQQGSQPWMVVLTTLLIAALFTPLRRGLQAVIDRRFDRARYDAARTLESFGASLRGEVDLSQLSVSLLKVVDQSLHPTHVSLWLHPQSAHLHEREFTQL